MSRWRLEACTALDRVGWLELRCALWRQGSREEHLAEMVGFVQAPQCCAQFVARIGDEAVDLPEVSLRHDCVLGTEGPPPIGFLEALYVAPAYRRQGVARRLVDAAIQWAGERGCREFASGALLDNLASHAVHRALGFAQTERVECVAMRLRPR